MVRAKGIKNALARLTGQALEQELPAVAPFPVIAAGALTVRPFPAPPNPLGTIFSFIGIPGGQQRQFN